MRPLLAALLLLLTANAVAEPIPTARLVFYPGPGLDRVAAELAKTGEDDRNSVSADMGRDYDGITEVHVVANRADFEAALPPGAVVPAWADGVAFPNRNLVIVRVKPNASTRATLRHELSHVAVGRLTKGLVPRWFLEGLATIRAGDAWSREGRSLILAGLSNDLIPFAALENGFPERPTDAELAYAESASFVQYLIDRSSESAMQDVLRRVVAGDTFEDALTHVMGANPRRLENAWRLSLEKWVLALDLVTSRDFFWMTLSFLFIFAWWKVRRTRTLRLQRLEKEERAEAARTLIRTPAIWADGPPKPAEPVPAPVPAPDPVVSQEAQVFTDAGEEPDERIPKKPTLH